MINICYEEQLRKRLIQLRLRKNVSCREMSLALGQSEGYINKIETSDTLPSMGIFFNICSYLNVTPREFFTFDMESPSTTNRLVDQFSRLSFKKQEHLLAVVEDMSK